jgi:hypothetical protein
MIRLLAFGIGVTMAFTRLDSNIAIGICLVISALFLFVFWRPSAFYINSRKGRVINEFFQSYPISDLEIMEREAFIRNLRIDLSHLSDEEMAYIKEQIPNNFIQPDSTSPEAVYVNLLILRAIESKEQVQISRTNLISIPGHDIDAESICFENVVARCKELMSNCNPLHVVTNIKQRQEDLINISFEEDRIVISVVT